MITFFRQLRRVRYFLATKSEFEINDENLFNLLEVACRSFLLRDDSSLSSWITVRNVRHLTLIMAIEGLHLALLLLGRLLPI